MIWHLVGLQETKPHCHAEHTDTCTYPVRLAEPIPSPRGRLIAARFCCKTAHSEFIICFTLCRLLLLSCFLRERFRSFKGAVVTKQARADYRLTLLFASVSFVVRCFAQVLSSRKDSGVKPCSRSIRRRDATQRKARTSPQVDASRRRAAPS